MENMTIRLKNLSKRGFLASFEPFVTQKETPLPTYLIDRAYFTRFTCVNSINNRLRFLANPL